MQTFLPYPDFTKTAKCLDYRRLGKQRVEARQIVDILEGRAKSGAWRNHPAVRMWEGFEDCLKRYFNAISHEWEGVIRQLFFLADMGSGQLEDLTDAVKVTAVSQ